MGGTALSLLTGRGLCGQQKESKGFCSRRDWQAKESQWAAEKFGEKTNASVPGFLDCVLPGCGILGSGFFVCGFFDCGFLGCGFFGRGFLS